MKMLVSLLVAVTLVSPAFAQKIVLQGNPPKPKINAVAPAAKPVLLHTGKPITQDQKRQLLASAIQAYTAKLPAGQKKPQVTSVSTTPITISPDQLLVNGFFAWGAFPFSISPGVITFNSGSSSNLIFVVTASPNTAYTLTIKVHAYAQNPQFVLTAGEPTAPQTTEGGNQGENEIAYALVSNSTGTIPVTMYSSNSMWNFESAELTSSSF
jgi:hypothetical protein